MKHVYLVVLLAVTGMTPLQAQNDPNTAGLMPQDILKVRLGRVIAILKQDDIDRDQKVRLIEKAVMPMFDFPVIGKLCLGRTHWENMSPAQQTRFIDLFIKLIKFSYTEKLMLYSGEQIEYLDPVQTSVAAKVPTQLVGTEKKISVLYKFRKFKDGWRIYDVEIQDVSLVKSYQSQFNEVIQKQGIEGFLEQLQKTLENQAAAPDKDNPPS